MYQEGLAQAKFLTSGIQEDRNKMLDLALKREEAMYDLLKDNPADYKEVRGGLYNIKTGTWVVPPKADEDGGLSNTQIDNARAIANSFEGSPVVKNFLEIQDRYLNARTYTGRGDGATDIATIYDLMKVLDPTSVVREAEYETGANKSGNIFAGALARFNGLIDPKGGFVSDQAKQNIFKVIEDRYNTRKKTYDQLRSQKLLQADDVTGGQGSKFITDYAGDLVDFQPSPEEELVGDIGTLISSGKTREQIADELFRDYGKDGFTRDEIYFDYVLKEIPDS